MVRSSRRTRRLAAVAILFAALGAVAFATRRVTVLRLAGGSEVEVVRDVAYVPGSGHSRHRLDVYRPPGARGAAVVHFVHGGYWVRGDKDYLAPLTGLYGSVGRALAARGLVAVVQSYRLAPEVGIEGILDDVAAAVEWTRTSVGEHGGDPDRLVLMGHSAGGHLVASIAADPDRREGVRGVVAVSAVFDVEAMAVANDDAFEAEVTVPVFGRDPAARARFSPVRSFDAGTPPFLVMIGEEDYAYLRPQARAARDALERLGRPVTFVEIPGNSHEDMVLAFGARDDDVTGHVARFVDAVAGAR